MKRRAANLYRIYMAVRRRTASYTSGSNKYYTYMRLELFTFQYATRVFVAHASDYLLAMTELYACVCECLHIRTLRLCAASWPRRRCVTLYCAVSVRAVSVGRHICVCLTRRADGWKGAKWHR